MGGTPAAPADGFLALGFLALVFRVDGTVEVGAAEVSAIAALPAPPLEFTAAGAGGSSTVVDRDGSTS